MATRPGVVAERLYRAVVRGVIDRSVQPLRYHARPRGGAPLQVPNSQWWQLHNFGTSSLSILLCWGGGKVGWRSGNMGAVAFGATVAGVPPPQTIVVGGAAGGTMEGPLEEATWSMHATASSSCRLDR